MQRDVQCGTLAQFAGKRMDRHRRLIDLRAHSGRLAEVGEIGRKAVAQVNASRCEFAAQQGFAYIETRLGKQLRMIVGWACSRNAFLPCQHRRKLGSRPTKLSGDVQDITGLRSGSPQSFSLGSDANQDDIGEDRRRASPGDSEVSPPARGTRCISPRACRPSKKRSTQARPSALASIGAGSARERNAASGVAPIAARSLSPRARQRWPTDSGGCKSRRKWRPSSVKSVVTRISDPACGRRIAQSSPMPSVMDLPAAGSGGGSSRSGPALPAAAGAFSS